MRVAITMRKLAEICNNEVEKYVVEHNYSEELDECAKTSEYESVFDMPKDMRESEVLYFAIEDKTLYAELDYYEYDEQEDIY